MSDQKTGETEAPTTEADQQAMLADMFDVAGTGSAKGDEAAFEAFFGDDGATTEVTNDATKDEVETGEDEDAEGEPGTGETGEDTEEVEETAEEAEEDSEPDVDDDAGTDADEIAVLRALLNESAKVGTVPAPAPVIETEPEPVAPAPPPVTELTSEKFDEIVSDPKAFAAYIAGVKAQAIQEAVVMASESATRITETRNMVNLFFQQEQNADLQDIADFVVAEARKLESSEPGKPVLEILQAAADGARAKLKMAKPVAKKKAPKKKMTFAPTSSQRASKAKVVKKDDFFEELKRMKEL